MTVMTVKVNYGTSRSMGHRTGRESENYFFPSLPFPYQYHHVIIIDSKSFVLYKLVRLDFRFYVVIQDTIQKITEREDEFLNILSLIFYFCRLFLRKKWIASAIKQTHFLLPTLLDFYSNRRIVHSPMFLFGILLPRLLLLLALL